MAEKVTEEYEKRAGQRRMSKKKKQTSEPAGLMSNVTILPAEQSESESEIRAVKREQKSAQTIFVAQLL